MNNFNSKCNHLKKGIMSIIYPLYILYLFATLCFCLSSINSQAGNYSLVEGAIKKQYKPNLLPKIQNS